MKTVLFIVGAVFIFIAAIATPVSIGYGIYEWVAIDMEFKFALWEGFKLWVTMILTGLVIGMPCYMLGSI